MRPQSDAWSIIEQTVVMQHMIVHSTCQKQCNFLRGIFLLWLIESEDAKPVDTKGWLYC